MKVAPPVAPLLMVLVSACGQPADQATEQPADAPAEPEAGTRRIPQFENEQ